MRVDDRSRLARLYGRTRARTGELASSGDETTGRFVQPVCIASCARVLGSVHRPDVLLRM
jgi:hypothetical protein